jgi:alpha-N-arabinofuranosidase
MTTAPRCYCNPILPGFYPDPSICRVGEDYYLITSSFEYFPGVPIFHSRDLVHWRQIGHVLSRPSQLNLDGVLPSQGIYAATIRHHAGRFYMVTTLRRPAGDGQFSDSNFVVTAADPAGPWSEPVVLLDTPGVIDPSLFFDDDGRAWYTANTRVAQPLYPGHRDIWMQEFDAERLCLVGERTVLWNGALKEASTPEAPHVYKIDGMYYLLIAEAGTYHDHAVTVARSEIVTGPYRGNPRNPILTHRHLGLDYPITNTGHADLVQTQTGEWWLVCLASRPCGGYFYNLGRETFLAPVRWEDGWPVVNPGHGRIEFEGAAPNLPEHPWPPVPTCDPFDTPELALPWNFLRTPRQPFWSLTARPGWLRLELRPERLTDLACPAFVGRRQQHLNFQAWTIMEFQPRRAAEEAGVVLLQNHRFHFRFVCTVDGEGRGLVRLSQRRGDEETVLAECPAAAARHCFQVEAVGQEYSFCYGATPERLMPVATAVDGRLLSTQAAGGFTGAYIGLYASSNGEPSTNVADVDGFEVAPGQALGQFGELASRQHAAS